VAGDAHFGPILTIPVQADGRVEAARGRLTEQTTVLNKFFFTPPESLENVSETGRYKVRTAIPNIN